MRRLLIARLICARRGHDWWPTSGAVICWRCTTSHPLTKETL